ncbi:MAG: sigma-70 family RNA polymerase sigma factor [Lachnospiraceae bacterium]|nr:sigma-70 family RNA polymerase sigma factor [Lachnospiraceae bacterium]
MGSQQEFLEGLQDLVRIAKTNGDVLTQEEVRDYFSDIDLDDAKMSLVAAYMAENQIRIAGVLPNTPAAEDEEIFSEEEPSAVLHMYMEEMKEISSMYDQEEFQFLKQLEQGDSDAVERLVEMNLKEVVDLANQYRGRGMQMNDLIQEGNLALFCAITEYDKESHGNFHRYMVSKVRKAIEDAIKDNVISTRGARKMVQQINQMNELAMAMAKEYGREAKPEELAEKMNITVEEVKELMKVSLDAVNVFEQK